MVRANQLVSYYMWYTSTLYNSSAFQFRLNSNHPNNSLLACITKRRAGVVRKSLEFLFQFGLKNGMIIVKPRAMDILDAIRSANEGIACEQKYPSAITFHPNGRKASNGLPRVNGDFPLKWPKLK